MMENKKIEEVIEKIQNSLDESLKVLEEADASLKSLDKSLNKAYVTIRQAKFCVENTRKLLNNYSPSNHLHNSTVFNSAKPGGLSHEQIRLQLLLELRYFSLLVNKLTHLDPYYIQLQYHSQKLAIDLKNANNVCPASLTANQ